MIAFSDRACPVCGGHVVNRLKQVSVGFGSDFPLPNTFWISICEKCGCGFADTVASREDYDDYYSKCNFYSLTPSATLDGENFFNKVKDLIKQRVPSGAHIIDMGCGRGDLLVGLREQLGYDNILGIDPSALSILHLQELGIKGVVGSAYDAPSGVWAKRADVVFFTSVVEHMLSPKEALRNLSEYLHPGGLLFMDAPDYSEVGNKTTPIPNEFNHEHINYCSEEMVRNLLSGLPYSVVTVKKLPYKSSQSIEHGMLFLLEKTSTAPFSEIIKDETTPKAIEQYLAASERRNQSTIDCISKFEKSGEKIFVWGTGSYASSLLYNTRLCKCNIIAFLDNRKLLEGEFHGLPVWEPQKAALCPTAPILICSMLSSNSIFEQAKDMGLQNPCFIL